MALKGDRDVKDDNITYTCPVAVERGTMLVVSTAGSGISLGASAGAATLVSNPSGYKVAGMLYGDVVDVDQTRYHLNFHKDETNIGNRVRVVTKGRMCTNKVTGTPTDGDTAYLTTSGVLTPTMSSGGGLVATPKVGTFKGSIDENGYATVDLNIPVV